MSKHMKEFIDDIKDIDKDFWERIKKQNAIRKHFLKQRCKIEYDTQEKRR